MSRKDEIMNSLMENYPKLNKVEILSAYELLLHSCKLGGKILTCGNGGSASDAEHIVGELMKGFRLKRELSKEEKEKFDLVNGGREIADQLQKGIQAISLNSQTSLINAIGNDTSYDMVFAQQVYVYGGSDDILIAMSTSGNASNVVNAAKVAKVMGMKVIGIMGEGAGKLREFSDVCLSMPAQDTYLVQEYTLPVYHGLCAMLEETLYNPVFDS